jgi:D-mannonate dehydratase
MEILLWKYKKIQKFKNTIKQHGFNKLEIGDTPNKFHIDFPAIDKKKRTYRTKEGVKVTSFK